MAENRELSLMVESSGPPLSGELTYPDLFPAPAPLMKPGPRVLLLAGMVLPELGRVSLGN